MNLILSVLEIKLIRIKITVEKKKQGENLLKWLWASRKRLDINLPLTPVTWTWKIMQCALKQDWVTTTTKIRAKNTPSIFMWAEWGIIRLMLQISNPRLKGGLGFSLQEKRQGTHFSRTAFPFLQVFVNMIMLTFLPLVTSWPLFHIEFFPHLRLGKCMSCLTLCDPNYYLRLAQYHPCTILI